MTLHHSVHILLHLLLGYLVANLVPGSVDMAPHRLRSCTLLLLPLLVATAVASAGSKPSTTNFQAHLLGRAATADADDYYHQGHEVVELVEHKLTNCRTFG